MKRLIGLGRDVDDMARTVRRVVTARGDDGIGVGRRGPAVGVNVAQTFQQADSLEALLINARHVTPQMKAAVTFVCRSMAAVGRSI